GRDGRRSAAVAGVGAAPVGGDVAEDLGEKTELPTERRRSEAREKGQVARSVDLTSAMLMTAAVILMLVFARPLLEGLVALVRYSLSERALGAGVTPDR